MAELTVPPLLAHVPEISPPSRRRVLILPATLAVLGICIAWGAATSGQDSRREAETVRLQRDLLRSEAALLQAQLLHDSPDTVAKLARTVDEQRARHVSSYATYGRQFTQWDGYRYEEIATQGYAYHQPSDSDDVKEDSILHIPGETEPRLKNVVWYPLYPVLGAGLAKITGLSVSSALTVISQLCVVFAAMVAFIYARRHYYNRMPRLIGVAGGPAALPPGTEPAIPALIKQAEEHPTRRWDLSPQDTAALWAVAALLFGPCSIFLYANFTESLFVLLLCGFLYCLQGRWWWRAALIAAVASSCRAQGVLFGPILALVFIFRGDIRSAVPKFAVAFFLGIVSSLGLLAYIVFLQWKFGDPLAFMHAQTAWNVGIHSAQLFAALNPMTAMIHAMHFAFFTSPMDWPRLWEALCVIWPPIMLLILGGRFLSFELEVVGWLLWGLPFVSNSLAGNPPGTAMWMSMGRFTLVLIPAHIIFGALFARFRWAGVPWLAAWASVFALFAFKFGMGEWIG